MVLPENPTEGDLGEPAASLQGIAFAQIEPTTRCNFICGFCCGRHMPQEDLDFDAFLRTLDALPDLKHLELQGEGEPLMHPRFFEMVHAARKRDIEVYFISNGSFFTRDNVERIVEAGVRHIAVSIESPDAATFARIRGGKLSKVTDGIRRLLATRERLGSTRPALGFAAMMMQGTRHELPAIIALYNALGMDGGIGIQMLQAAPAYARFYDDDLKRQVIGNDEAKQLYLDLAELPQLVDIRSRQQSTSYYRRIVANWEPASGTCPWLENGIFVMRDGMASACCYMKDGAQHGFGKFDRDGAARVAERRERLRAEFRNRVTPEACRGCSTARKIEVAQDRVPQEGKRRLALI